VGNFAFNIAKGRPVQQTISDATKFGILLLKVAEADATLIDYATVAAILAGANTEANFTNYARKTSITATATVDNANDRTDIDVPDQTFASAGGATNNNLVKLIVFYEVSASDAGRVPISAHDFVATTDGNDLVAVIATAGFYRAA
jgi:hypothetical protein